jgi:hypothetical protein
MICAKRYGMSRATVVENLTKLCDYRSGFLRQAGALRVPHKMPSLTFHTRKGKVISSPFDDAREISWVISSSKFSGVFQFSSSRCSDATYSAHLSTYRRGNCWAAPVLVLRRPFNSMSRIQVISIQPAVGLFFIEGVLSCRVPKTSVLPASSVTHRKR